MYKIKKIDSLRLITTDMTTHREQKMQTPGEQMRAENEQMRKQLQQMQTPGERMRAENEQMRKQLQQMQTHGGQMRAENEQMRKQLRQMQISPSWAIDGYKYTRSQLEWNTRIPLWIQDILINHANLDYNCVRSYGPMHPCIGAEGE